MISQIYIHKITGEPRTKINLSETTQYREATKEECERINQLVNAFKSIGKTA